MGRTRGRLMAAAIAAAALILLGAPSLLTASGDPEEATGARANDRLRPTEELVGGALAVVEGLLDAPASAAPDADAVSGEPEGDDPSAGGGARNPRSARESDPGPTARASGSGSVDIRDFAFSPRTITIQAGEPVRWTNRDRELHDATAFDGSFNTRLLERGESEAVTFREPGSFRYFCSVHPSSQPRYADFTGTVRVLPAEDDRDERAPRRDPDERPGSGIDRVGPSGPAATGAAGRPSPTAELEDRGDRGRGLPITGLAVPPLIALGLILLTAGAALRLGGR